MNADIHYLMRFKNLEDEFRRVCGMIGVPNHPLPIRNGSNREDYNQYCDEILIQLALDGFQEEILRMDYHFGG